MTELDDKLETARAALRAKQAARDEARRLLDERDREVDVAAAYVKAWEEAVALLRLPSNQPKRPIGATGSPLNGSGRTASKGKGRQVGAISKIWRGVLSEMTAYYPEGAADEQIAEIGRSGELRNLRARDARRQMQKYRELGFVDYADPPLESAWKVTPNAARKFGIEIPESKAAADSPSAAARGFSSAERV
jgi:hypothetical protein